jgi:hypothetical protein
MKVQKIDFVIEDEKGDIYPLREGQKGTVQSVDSIVENRMTERYRDLNS